MEGSLSERYQSRIDRSKRGYFRTRIKKDEEGNRIGGGTKVTQSTVDAIRGDECVQLVIAENNVSVISDAIDSAVTAAMEEIGLVAEGAAKRLCPVDTGRLRNSITHAFVTDKEIVVGTNVEYAVYVHEGTSRRDGVRFLYDAVANNVNRFNAIMRKHMGGA